MGTCVGGKTASKSLLFKESVDVKIMIGTWKLGTRLECSLGINAFWYVNYYKDFIVISFIFIVYLRKVVFKDMYWIYFVKQIGYIYFLKNKLICLYKPIFLPFVVLELIFWYRSPFFFYI